MSPCLIQMFSSHRGRMSLSDCIVTRQRERAGRKRGWSEKPKTRNGFDRPMTLTRDGVFLPRLFLNRSLFRRLRRLPRELPFALLRYRPHPPFVSFDQVNPPLKLLRPSLELINRHLRVRRSVEPVAQIRKLLQPGPDHVVHVPFDHAKRRLVCSRDLEVLVKQRAVHVALHRQR